MPSTWAMPMRTRARGQLGAGEFELGFDPRLHALGGDLLGAHGFLLLLAEQMERRDQAVELGVGDGGLQNGLLAPVLAAEGGGVPLGVCGAHEVSLRGIDEISHGVHADCRRRRPLNAQRESPGLGQARAHDQLRDVHARGLQIGLVGAHLVGGAEHGAALGRQLDGLAEGKRLGVRARRKQDEDDAPAKDFHRSPWMVLSNGEYRAAVVASTKYRVPSTASSS